MTNLANLFKQLYLLFLIEIRLLNQCNSKLQQVMALNKTPITYYPLQLLCVYCMKLFFRDVTVIGQENMPKNGPVILYGNHNNQFVDGLVLLFETQLMMANIKRPVSFIAAAVSMRRRFLGPFIRGTGAIPVQRPQDIAYKGKGKIVRIYGNRVIGVGTKFLELNPAQIVSITQMQNKKNKQLKVKQLISDNQFIFDGDPEQLQGQSCYSVIPKLQYNQLYDHVWKALNDQKCIGIFPEGGSHDQMQLLPLKAGICIMALGAVQKYGKPVKLVPCGFNYYDQSKFRSKVVMQLGEAYTIPQQLVELYRKNKKEAISILLTNLQQMLRQVTTQLSSFKEVNTLYLARKLYTLNATRQLSIKQKLHLNRRFAKGFKVVASKPEYAESYKSLVQFSEFVRINGIKITKQNYFSNLVVDFFKFFFYLEKCLLRSIIALPGIILMGPTTGLISYLTEKQKTKCKKNSKLKEQARDVIGSYKILLSIFLLPPTAIVHSSLLFQILIKKFGVNQNKALKASLISFFLLPIYALVMVKSYDSFGQSWAKLKYLFWRLFNRNFYEKFNEQKRNLNKKILQFIDKHGNEVVQNLQQNRILKKEHMIMANTELYIFQKGEMQFHEKQQ